MRVSFFQVLIYIVYWIEIHANSVIVSHRLTMWLGSSVVWVLARYARGTGFESWSGHVLFPPLLQLVASVLGNCHRSTMWLSSSVVRVLAWYARGPVFSSWSGCVLFPLLWHLVAQCGVYETLHSMASDLGLYFLARSCYLQSLRREARHEQVKHVPARIATSESLPSLFLALQ